MILKNSELTREFTPGTTGWTVQDLDDPAIERLWFQGRYELVDGVLTRMPPAYFSGGEALFNLMFLLKTHMRAEGIEGRWSVEVDIVLRDDRVARSGAAFMEPSAWRRHLAAARKAGKTDVKRMRVYGPPTLIIESVSPKHERHDEVTKRRWYAEAGVPHYRIVNALKQSLDLFVLNDGEYLVEASAQRRGKVRSTLFPK
jgi:Uma2 family endonuclease